MFCFQINKQIIVLVLYLFLLLLSIAMPSMEGGGRWATEKVGTQVSYAFFLGIIFLNGWPDVRNLEKHYGLILLYSQISFISHYIIILHLFVMDLHYLRAFHLGCINPVPTCTSWCYLYLCHFCIHLPFTYFFLTILLQQFPKCLVLKLNNHASFEFL